MQLVFVVALGLTAAGSALFSLPGMVMGWADRDEPAVVFSVETGERVVALSIDDGPSEATAEILEVLREHGARATFFVIGDHLQADPEGVRQIVEEGHELGHHMMSDVPSRDLPPEAFEARFVAMHELLEPLAPVALFRPASGWYDDQMVELAASHGYQTVLGTVYPFDAQHSWAGLSRRFLERNARPGAIVVLHDGAERGWRTAQVLREALPVLASEGYRVVSISELMSLGETRGR